MTEEQQEFMIFVGPRLSTLELAAQLRAEQASQASDGSEDEDLSFVSPRVPGRMQRGAPKPGGESE